ncbi:MAG: DHH family phosphoesterase, partial [Chloroflexota bacterium]
GETIAVYGDYDADGITATALLVEGLQALGANVIPYIPNRLEGHGVQAAALSTLAAKGASLVITVDGGTSSYEAVAQAQRRGQDIVITDHHTCVGQLPPAVAIVNPKREEADSLQRPLAGVGVAFKLLQALFRGQGREDELAGYYDLVALGTVTDMAPMRGENRYLVRQGLEHLNNPHRPGLQEMYRVAGVKPGGIDARTISWVLGPRINSAGRMEQAYLSYHLLRTSSSEEGRSLALELEQRNSERQKVAEETWLQVREVALSQREAKLLFIRSQDIIPGVIGLMAGRLAEEFQRQSHIADDRAPRQQRRILKYKRHPCSPFACLCRRLVVDGDTSRRGVQQS